ncbi:undecaprenyl diphosphate synthase family protein [Allokutzneria sp. A3M-2-11 16]|uniref:undecaprenyl diphosphate synthase family protein n=1 Tax=Allokutzneria sp. A3M-2-11 16 TaxID=2962043 RepID=UPI0035A93FD7
MLPSNFLPWHTAYAELVFTDVLWPDFDRRHLLDAVTEYSRRRRRFGVDQPHRLRDGVLDRASPGSPA